MFTRDGKLMGTMVNRKALTAVGTLFCGIIVVFNVYLLLNLAGLTG
jgi:Mn2+/Fe2+ NRAMP family transporter